MPLKLNVGLSKKIGLPDYGSLGATCLVEVELPAGLLDDGCDQFHEPVRRLYASCGQAVEDELARHGQDGDDDARRPGASAAHYNGESIKNPARGSRRTGSATHHASAKQLDYAAQLAGRIRGLGERRLESLSQRMFGKSVADLSSLDASGLIDALKAIKAGEIDVGQALNGAAA
jgi:hypothetical protein